MWWSYTLGLVAGIALTPLTYLLVEWWWTRYQRRATGWHERRLEL
jgi:hypothetical protein